MKVLLLNLPYHIRGFVKNTAEPDGDFQTIVINARLGYLEQRKAYWHERRHIEGSDLYREETADQIEGET